MAVHHTSFAERVVRTQAVKLIQITCLRCGFVAVGRKAQVRAVESEHKRRCRAPALPPNKPAQPSV